MQAWPTCGTHVNQPQHAISFATTDLEDTTCKYLYTLDFSSPTFIFIRNFGKPIMLVKKSYKMEYILSKN
jgi:hypothetical protein